MPVDRNMRLPDLAQGGSVTVGELIDAIAAQVAEQVMAKVETAVLADLRAMLSQATTNQARPTKPQEPRA